MTESIIATNFNFGFSTSKSEILLHLSQWQYWWWFWFSLVWSMYFFFIIRVSHKRVLHFNPILNTSIRGHGKWGDFLVALIPLSWCGNILINSNFILRMIEWQNEGSLFTLRVQGKQWYWVYKLDSGVYSQLTSQVINVGSGSWRASPATTTTANASVNELLNLGTQNEFLSAYTKLLAEAQLSKDVVESSIVNYNYVYASGDSSVVNANNVLHIPTLDDTTNFAANLIQGRKAHSFELMRTPLNLEVLDLLTADKLSVNVLIKPIFLQNFSSVEEKQVDTELFWGFRQKKYKRLSSFNPNKSILINRQLVSTRQLIRNLYSSVKFSRNRGELVPTTLARRLLRTKRTLVLPAHTNITVITNSYDVVHSWFIPGLGIKLDCVPGRSTHHTFYIDNVGFYYGQCAEICGRYHHHMPIRLCALPMEQFIVWWQHKGLSRTARLA